MSEYYHDNRDEGYLYGTVIPGGVSTVEHIEVYPPFRGQGHGSMMLQAFIYYCGTLRVEEIRAVMNPESGTDISRLVKFYENNGFTTKPFGKTVFMKL